MCTHLYASISVCAGGGGVLMSSHRPACSRTPGHEKHEKEWITISATHSLYHHPGFISSRLAWCLCTAVWVAWQLGTCSANQGQMQQEGLSLTHKRQSSPPIQLISLQGQMLQGKSKPRAQLNRADLTGAFSGDSLNLYMF